MFYFLETNNYNLYVAISNGLIWLSHGNIFLINLFFNNEFNQTFYSILPAAAKKNRVLN